ncbi:MAG TPA: FKBP-type peptidyl-prolyl cis-trans isomerase [Rickettsiales bacterium]|nr:FKBP-type peptidyl-prolyl cis-trans isomerase [Rickettsiales bacterium]
MPKFTPNSLQSVGRWVVLVILAYGLFHTTYILPKKPVPQEPQPSSVPQANKPDADCAKKSVFPLMSVPLLPGLIPVIKSEDAATGTGEAAVCGQKALVTYSYGPPKKDPTASGTKEIVIGGGSEPHGVELGLIGMKPGGKRTVTMPYPMTMAISPIEAVMTKQHEVKIPSLIAQLELKKVEPAVPVSAQPLRFINTDIIGNGGEAMCGDRVIAEITLWKMDGSKFFSTEDKPLTFVIGQSQLPYGIEQGIGGMMEGGVRLVVVPPAYAKPLIDSGEKSRLLPSLPENEMILAEIRLLHIDVIKAKEDAADDQPAGETGQTDASKPAETAVPADVKSGDTRAGAPDKTSIEHQAK